MSDAVLMKLLERMLAIEKRLRRSEKMEFSTGSALSSLYAALNHYHSGGAITSGTISPSYLPTASTSQKGCAPQASAPSSGIRNVLAIDYGETGYKVAAMFDNTNPAALGAAAPGTSLIAARRDHVHPLPATVNNGYALQFGALVSSVPDSTTLYMGCMPSIAPTTLAGGRAVVIPKSATLKNIAIRWLESTPCSSESVQLYFRYDNTYDTTITTTFILSNTNARSLDNLSVAVSLAHFFEIKIVFPNMGTNGSGIFSGTAYFET